MGCSPRAKMILSTATVVLSVIGAIVGLTIGLQDQPPPCGGSPECDVGSSGQRAEQNQVIHARERRSADSKVDTEYKYDKFSGNVRFLDSIEPWAASSEYRTYPSAAVTTDTNICSKIGADILRDGVGSAVDSAIATQLCVCIVNAQSCGIGGGHIAVIYERPRDQSEKVLMALIARERAPAAAYRDMFVNNTQGSVKGGLAVAVPGEIRGFHEAWKIFGRLPWSDLFQPSIQLCEEGFLVERSLAAAILDKEVEIREDPNLSELFVKEDGTLLKQGDLLVNPKLGRTMRAIAEDPLTFYSGALAEDIVNDLNEYSGIITLEDLQQYQSTLNTPINITLQNGDLTVHSPSSPSSGPVLEFILNILDGYNFDSTSISDDASKTLTYHRITEAFKFAFAKRSMLGDAEFVDVSDLVYNLTSDEYAESIRQQIDDTFTHDIEYYGPTFDVIPDHGTTHMNVLAPDGAAVALSGTINLFFGSKCRGSRTGIIFNNEMDDFSTPGTRNDFGVPASPSNYIVPGKVPMSSMNPALFVDKDGSVIFMSGGAGGTKITTQTAFVSINSLWLGLGLDVATDTARIHHQLSPNQIVFENWIDQMVLMGLRAKNHTVVSTTGNAVILSIRNSCSGVPTIQGRSKKASDCVEAISDGRKGGFPDGF